MRSPGLTRGKKKGSYIVEAAMVMPVFVLAMLLLVNIIPVIGTAENIAYGTAEEMRLEMAKGAFRSDMPALPLLIRKRAMEENSKVEKFTVTGYKYRYTRAGTRDLITLQFRSIFHQPDPFGVFKQVRFDGCLTGRAWTGSYYNGEEADDIVYVFPERGKCYHESGCTFLRSHCHQVRLTSAVRKHYRACPNCGAGKAADGSPVFIFEEYGDAYHTAECKAVDKYYIDISRRSAIENGYTPCSKCGGE